MTSCWSKGRTKHYPYYICHHKACESYGKSIPRAKLEGQFEELLKQLQSTVELVNTAQKMFEQLWEHMTGTQKERKRALEVLVKKIDKKIEQLLDKIVDIETQTVISAYEKRINKLEMEKAEIREKTQNITRPVRSYDTAVRTALEFLSNPHKLWASERYEDKRTMLKLTFTDKLS